MFRHFVVKFGFRASLKHCPILTFFFDPRPLCPRISDCTDHSAYTTLNWGAGGIRELTLNANKIEQCRKVYFPKSVSTTFVPRC